MGVVLESWLVFDGKAAVGVVPDDSLETMEVGSVGVVSVGVLVTSVAELLDSVTIDVAVSVSIQLWQAM